MIGLRNLEDMIVDEIELGSLFLEDSRTFLKARTTASFRGKGGGNWSIVLLGMATLSFYGKIYCLLDGESRTFIERRDKEFECVWRLISSGVVDFGLSSLNRSEVLKIWQKFRNTPAHLAVLAKNTGGQVFTRDGVDGWSFTKITSAIDKPLDERLNDKELVSFAGGEPGGLKSFASKDGAWLCNSDILIADLILVKEALISKSKSADQIKQGEILAYLLNRSVVK